MKIVCVNEYADMPALNGDNFSDVRINYVGTWTRVSNNSDESARFLHITKGKLYEVVDIGISFIKIINDKGHDFTYPRENFKTIEEVRDIKLNQILE